MARPLCLSLSGAGFLGVYHIGVVQCLRQHLPADTLRQAKVAGASAGALVGSMLVIDAPLEPCLEAFLTAAETVRRLWGGAFNPNSKLDLAITGNYSAIVAPDAYARTAGRLFVSVTELPLLRNRLLADFRSNADLLDALLCSSYIPGFTASTPPTFRGQHYIDGGFSNNFPAVPGSRSGERAIIVAPFAGQFDICPVRPGAPPPSFAMYGYYPSAANLTAAVHALYPPDTAGLLKVYRDGYDHTLAYLRDRLGIQVAPTVPGASFDERQPS